MKHYVYVVEDCTPKLYEFSSAKKRDKFLSKFESDPWNGYWIDLVFSGTLKTVDFATELVKEKK